MDSGLVVSKIDVQELIKNFTYTPYPARVVVKEVEVERTVGGLYIPDTSKDSEMKTNEGYVIAIGEGVDFCSPGDLILYGRYSGAWFEIDGEKFRIMNEKDIVAKCHM